MLGRVGLGPHIVPVELLAADQGADSMRSCPRFQPSRTVSVFERPFKGDYFHRHCANVFVQRKIRMSTWD